MSDDEEFQTTDAGSTYTTPTPCSNVKIGGYCMLKGYPCKVKETFQTYFPNIFFQVVAYSTAKTGKHGAAKAAITGIDIFTNKKCEETISTGHTAQVPIVVRTEYTLIDIGDDGFVTLMSDDGSTKEDLALPTDDDSKDVNIS